jgi:tRNA1(Val) A37 N6-methylase TrmN6
MESHLDHMNLYADENFVRIMNLVNKSASEKEGPLEPADVKGVDIMHYTSDYHELTAILDAHPEISTILDIGAGPAGASRYLAHKYNHVVITSLEYLQDLYTLGKNINGVYTKSGAAFTSRLTNICGDFLTYEPASPAFDFAMT